MDPTLDVLFATKQLILWKKVDFKAEGKLSTTKQEDRQKKKKCWSCQGAPGSLASVRDLKFYTAERKS